MTTAYQLRHVDSPKTYVPQQQAGFKTPLLTSSKPTATDRTGACDTGTASMADQWACDQRLREEEQWRDHLAKQERVRQAQAKQWEREEEDWAVQRQIEKQQEASKSKEPHSEAGAIVKASALRVDSAFAAAQCLKASLEADMSDPASSER